MRHPLFLFATAGWLVGCSDELPSPPDISTLERAYAAPTATVEDPAQLGDLANAILTVNRALGRGSVVIDGSAGIVRDPAFGLPEDTSDSLPYDLRGTGVARITHVCPGWADHEARRADLTGQLDLSVRFELGNLVPVMWGVADRCSFEVGGRRISIDGDLVIARIDRGILLSLTGALTAEDEMLVDSELDFVVHAGGVDYRKEIDGGHVVVTIARNGQLVVHAVNGDFACDTERCALIEPGVGGER